MNNHWTLHVIRSCVYSKVHNLLFGGKLDNTGKFILRQHSYKHTKVHIGTYRQVFTCAQKNTQGFRVKMALHIRLKSKHQSLWAKTRKYFKVKSVSFFKASPWNTFFFEIARRVTNQVKYLTYIHTHRKKAFWTNRMKIQVIYIGDRENMNNFTSQIVSGYMSYIHSCIHKYMYLGHLEILFTIYDQKWLYTERPCWANCAFLTCSNENATEPLLVNQGSRFHRLTCLQ